MYVLVFVDMINDSFGDNSIDGNRMIIAINESVGVLKTLVKEGDEDSGCSVVKWKKIGNQHFGKVYYDDEVEKDQHYVIVKVEQGE